MNKDLFKVIGENFIITTKGDSCLLLTKEKRL